jgi:hypothetical protein
MKQYIDKAALVTEIERRISVLKANESVISMLAGGMFVNEFKDLLSFINTLEAKEMEENAVEAVIHPYDGEIWVDKDLLSVYDDCQRVKLIIIK